MPSPSPFAPEKQNLETKPTPDVDVDDVAEDLAARNEEETKQEDFLEEKDDAAETVEVKAIEHTAPTGAASIVTPPVKKDEDVLEVEKILEEGLAPMFVSLPDDAKEKFREKGEIASHEIAGMVKKMEIDIKRVLRLIRDWLLTIPKVNKFFLEQEAKIKTDKILELVRMRKEDQNNIT